MVSGGCWCSAGVGQVWAWRSTLIRLDEVEEPHAFTTVGVKVSSRADVDLREPVGCKGDMLALLWQLSGRSPELFRSLLKTDEGRVGP